ncbi:hypothetical protein LCGC14_2136560 [marine sediment metagenome]|uniref:Uncharacterized protein n=1 Tax=marine sediment metagenome TaxID=412755 RepID=A0A0F9DZU4_9ZZZZ
MNSVRCSICPWSTALWLDGALVGYDKLAIHVAEEHEEEHRLVQEGLEEIDEDIRRAEEEAEGVY